MSDRSQLHQNILSESRNLNIDDKPGCTDDFIGYSMLVARGGLDEITGLVDMKEKV